MKQFQYTIKDELGVHARPAGLLVKLATASVPAEETQEDPLAKDEEDKDDD